LLSPSRCTTPPLWPSGAPRHRRCSSNSGLPCIPQRAPPPSQHRAPPRAHARSSRQSLEWPHHLAVRPQSRWSAWPRHHGVPRAKPRAP
jgi:hypothetical protein